MHRLVASRSSWRGQGGLGPDSGPLNPGAYLQAQTHEALQVLQSRRSQDGGSRCAVWGALHGWCGDCKSRYQAGCWAQG